MRITEYATYQNDEQLPYLVKKNSRNYPDEQTLTDPVSVANMMNTIFCLSKQTEEQVYLLCLDTKAHLKGVFHISTGTVDASLLSPREIFMKALLCGATNAILVHNHPTGDPTPSSQDIQITKRCRDVGNLLNIQLLDHVIVGVSYKIYSFNNEGWK